MSFQTVSKNKVTKCNNPICQCCSCEKEFQELELNNGCCPHCGSGNWVRGYIDEPLEDD